VRDQKNIPAQRLDGALIIDWGSGITGQFEVRSGQEVGVAHIQRGGEEAARVDLALWANQDALGLIR